MMDTIGASIEDISKGQVTLISEIRPSCLQQHGFGHAALTFALGDTAAGYAALSVMPDEAEVLTTEMKINLLAPSKGRRLRAVGRVIKPGRRLVITQADVYAEDESGTETHIALLTGTMIPVLP
ncbi:MULTISPECIES: PaaI family thioesterase [Shimia]|uniref:PaaI family thioesterase n=1 Tax=Shimia TaxID=573139 RepID=UPI001FB50776|nr:MULTISPECIES: PaaI family thioesterase [Shimia]MDV4145767.1 PaaI family thioesterase [Shimia sp. FJ5]